MQQQVFVALSTVAAAFWWCSAATAWNVTRLYGTPLPARLTDVAVWRNRAYACWPRVDASSQPVTLLELPWPETREHPWGALTAVRWSPRRSFHADQQVSAQYTATSVRCLYDSNNIVHLQVDFFSLLTSYTHFLGRFMFFRKTHFS